MLNQISKIFAKAGVNYDFHTGCINWAGTKTKYGYGVFKYKGKQYRAHRASFFAEHGRWPEPMCLHKCDNRLCVNEDHLYEGTALQNSQDRVRRKRCNNPRGELRSNAKLTKEKVYQIRELYSSGTMSYRDISGLYGVTWGTIRDVIKERSWRHV